MQGVHQLVLVLQVEQENHILAITIWALGQIGKHSPEHAKAIADTNVFTCILAVSIVFYTKGESGI